MMKYEAFHRNKISAHLIEDAMSAKCVFLESTQRENILFGIHSNSRFQLRGYIHELGSDPFGYLLMSQFQVRYYKNQNFY